MKTVQRGASRHYIQVLRKDIYKILCVLYMHEHHVCIICHNSNSLIKYHSHCGIHYIHRYCLSQWLNKSNYQCIICRSNLRRIQLHNGQTRHQQHPLSIITLSLSLINTLSIVFLCFLIYNVSLDVMALGQGQVRVTVRVT